MKNAAGAKVCSAEVNRKIMFRTIFLIFGIGVVLAYSSASWFGWEFANSGSNSRLGMPFIYGGGFRGGK